MTTSTRILIAGRTLLLGFLLTLALATVAGPQPAVACSDTAERYPMLIGSGYEGESCELADASCSDVAEMYPMLLGSGYEGEPCGPSTSNTTVARSTNRDWHETMLDGSGYEPAAIGVAYSGRDRD